MKTDRVNDLRIKQMLNENKQSIHLDEERLRPFLSTNSTLDFSLLAYAGAF